MDAYARGGNIQTEYARTPTPMLYIVAIYYGIYDGHKCVKAVGWWRFCRGTVSYCQ